MGIDLESLYDTVDQLEPQQRMKLMNYLTSGDRTHPSNQSVVVRWQFNLAHHMIYTTSDFDDPLPDEFWTGEA